MSKKRGMELMVGLFMIAGFLAFAVLAIKVSGLTDFHNGATFVVEANFTNIGDLKERAPVTIAGVNIGRVRSIHLDPKTYKAVVTLEINKSNDNIPVDSTANIFTAGLLGANYISINPGFDDQFLKNGDVIENTNQALILQNIIGQIMFSLKNKK
ncbi:MAG: outer membrane lipid asymmetry maintenance protein MlaD [Pseudomonadota bacterium]|nr:outer membrane lipid asymmetry maintenance protein MlaD [Gammaproteobacteria bacterium]MBU1558931.1 outer membrane lipid asymmetry maintenance protein MlaD [Gammaproteobacteria bacterium]MBU1628690.1 outer membrane lipid asymmetry maintenance protein MlaD [Gammaproteobacteria bacterium]MBU2545687.1 outer membrane lipid asymmetry maintenance protein MlaD [Gammaproteobacteria bacterium]